MGKSTGPVTVQRCPDTPDTWHVKSTYPDGECLAIQFSGCGAEMEAKDYALWRYAVHVPRGLEVKDVR